MTFTTNQWAILALVLVLGWLLGLMSRSGGGRWKRDYHRERAERTALERDHAAQLATANARVAELERARPVAPVAPIAAAAPIGAVAATTAGTRDDLTLIRGVDSATAARLNEAGVHSFLDVAALGPADEAGLETRIGRDVGSISRENWRDQAALLADGRMDEHRTRFV